MTPRTKRIVGKSLVVTIIAIVATFGLSFTARLALQMPIDWLSWVECTFIPILIGMPVSAYIFTQSEMIQDSCGKLEKSHAALTEAHDRLSFVTSHDPMTGLLSRGGFMARMDRSRDEEECDTLLLIDPDHFSSINEAWTLQGRRGSGSDCKGARLCDAPRGLGWTAWRERVRRLVTRRAQGAGRYDCGEHPSTY